MKIEEFIRSSILIDKNLPKYNLTLKDEKYYKVNESDPDSSPFMREMFSSTERAAVMNKAVREFMESEDFKTITDILKEDEDIVKKFNSQFSPVLNSNLVSNPSNFWNTRENFVLGSSDREDRDRKFWGRVKKLFSKISQSISSTQQMTMQEFFSTIKVKISDSKPFVSRLDKIISTIKNAKELGQISLVETLIDRIAIDVYENALFFSDYLYSISYEDLLLLQNKCKKSLDITYIKNFTRIIPEDVHKKKVEADTFLIFDNYVILHYDPEKKAQKDTKEEIEKKRDPILFGVINGSDKLYYIADWVDEYCDLTLDQFLSITGKTKDDIKTIKE